MKKLSLVTLFALITIGFSSCSAEDDILTQERSADALLKSYKIEQSTSGKYSLDYQLNDGVSTESVLDKETNTNNINLYLSDESARSISDSGLTLENGQLRVGFNNKELNTKHTITVMDSNIQTKGEQNKHVESWGMTGNQDGSGDLNFTVKEGVSVDVVFDGDRNVYEIHLNEDLNASALDFEETFVKEDGVALQVEFLNYSTTRTTNPNKEPVVIIED